MVKPVRSKRTGSGIEECITYILETYPQYTLAHFYTLNFKQGGLTNGQIDVLFRHAKERELEKFRMLASLQGLRFKDDEEQEMYAGTEFEGCVFGKPETYQHLTDEQKKRWTDMLMAHHSSIF